MDKGLYPLDLLTGRSKNHVILDQRIGLPVHQEVVAPLLALKEKSLASGFDLQVVSGFRSFKGQLSIWNFKARGKRPLLDENGIPLNYEELSEEEIVQGILRWSALPGASRHHWGTDIDIINHRALPSKDYVVELTPQEVADDGIFGPFHLWLDDLIKDHNAFGFFRPYAEDLGGVFPERWHLSYRPLASEFLDDFTYERFLESINQSEMDLLPVVKDLAPKIYDQFVLNICSK